MKSLFIQYKAVIKFIFLFLITYVVLTMAYKFYLQYSEGSSFYPDYVTNLVALQTENILQGLGFRSEVMPHETEPSMKVILNGTFVARVIEGCNGLSVIILFISFIVAFSGKLKTTFFYVLAGSVLIYVVNLVRIVILTMALYYYPEHREILHSVVFPAIIYGLVFLLWVFWVNRFSKSKMKDA